MRVRSLGAEGPTVAAVGAGDVSLVRAAARGVDAGEVSRALHEAIVAGIQVIDVAEEPDTERLVGDAVRALRVRDHAIVACRAPASRELVARVEASLRATRLDALPLAQLVVRSEQVSSTRWPELRGTCERLVQEGKVLRWGAYREDAEELDEPLFVSANVAFNVCERQAPLAKPPVAVLARRPLVGGALAGGLGPGVKLAHTDDRRDTEWERAAVGVAKLAAFVKRTPPAAHSCDAARAQLERNVRPPHLECETVAELALRFVIDRGAIALPRLHRREHVAEAIAAGAAPPLSFEVPELDT